MGAFPYNLIGHDPTSDPGIALRQWVHFQRVHNILDLLRWDQEELKVTENDAKHTFKTPCCCFENALTNDLLFF